MLSTQLLGDRGLPPAGLPHGRVLQRVADVDAGGHAGHGGPRIELGHLLERGRLGVAALTIRRGGAVRGRDGRRAQAT